MLPPLLVVLLACAPEAPRSPAPSTVEALPDLGGPDTGWDDPQVCNAPDEAGDTPEGAVALAPFSGEGTVCPDGDVDWWSFEADGPGWVALSAVGGTADGHFDGVFEIYSPEGDAWTHGLGWPAASPVYLARGGTWRIAVYDAGDRGGGSAEGGGGGRDDFAYTLALVPFDGAILADDAPFDLGDLTTGETREVAVVFADAGDTRTLVLPPGHPGMLSAAGGGYPYEAVQTSLSEAVVLDADGARVSSSSGASPALLSPDAAGGAEIRLTAAEAGWMLLRVGLGADVAVEQEPNDDWLDAQTVDGTFRGTFGTTGDVDWFWLAPHAGWSLSVRCDAQEAYQSAANPVLLTLVDVSASALATGTNELFAANVPPNVALRIENGSTAVGTNAWYLCSWTDTNPTTSDED